ncbi:trypsin-like peptidase domain-containing protein [Streptomyces sp. NPDC051963]|uniref:trypsin-like peptidase domain-containing protein n=1 Tax=Streptomyces sp. NPDC051963 TaxID=3365678 RepID=UPI0037D7D84B
MGGPGGGCDEVLVRIRDLAGRPRGTGFVADHQGTVVTSHEAVDGLTRLVLYGAEDRTVLVTADAVTPLPALNLALVRTEGLGVDPLPITVRDKVETGRYVRVPAGCWREARVLDVTTVTYTATDRFHLLDGALELAIGTAGRDALRLGGGAAGGPVLDVTTGAVVAVLGTALQSGHRDIGFAVPLPRTTDGPLADVLARNAETVPAYGSDLNLAGVLQLTATTVEQAALSGLVEPVERSATAREFAEFTQSPASVLALVGPPGSGRTTELASLASRRHRAPQPAPTLWLRGADLAPEDTSIADAAHRALDRAARVMTASSLTPAHLSHVAHTADRPLLLVLDTPEQMPPPLAHRLPEWTAATASWLRETGARLVLACREEYWEGAGVGFPGDLLHVPGRGARERSSLIPESRASDTGPLTSGRRAPDTGPLTSERPAHDACLSNSEGRAPDTGSLNSAAPAPDAGPHDSARPAFEDEALQADRGPGAEPRWGAGAEPRGGSGGAAPWRGRRGGAPGDGKGRGGGGETPGRSPRTHPHLAHPHLPPCVHLGDLTADEAAQARARYAIPEGTLTTPDARHPLTLRLLSEVQAALPEAPAVPLDRHDVFAAHLDLTCLRIADRLAAENDRHGTAVRRLAAKVSGRIHEAARRTLGAGQGELDRESFEELFPQGHAHSGPAHTDPGPDWASAVLTEGLLVPNGPGTGYRFTHEELADWLQGIHLDLDEALHTLLTHPQDPHHRIAPVVQSLLLLARRQGAPELAARLQKLVDALDTDPHSWWAARLLTEVLPRVPDATPYTGVLRLLADRSVAWRRHQHPALSREFGPAFWTALPLPEVTRFDLLRRLLLADPAPDDTDGPRYLDAAAHLLAADPTAVQPHLTRWFDDERPLPATPHATVAKAAQALLHTHRRRALDDLTEVLVDCAHRRADELLAVLAEDEPSAVCRAVDRWAHDGRPERRVAAAAYGLRAAPHVRTEADRELLRYAALALLAHPALHGGALALLVRDPRTRARHLPQALRHFASGDPQFPPSALVAALTTHPDPVLDAFRERLRRPDGGEALRTLADVTTPTLARRVAALVREAVQRRPQTAEDVAAYVDRRLDQGQAARSVLFPLVTGLLDGGPDEVRAALAAVLAARGAPVSRPLRRELLDFLLAHEHTPTVLDALLKATARHSGPDTRDLVRHIGLLLVRTPDGAARFDRGLVDLGRHVPGFATLVTGWLSDAPDEWAAVVGPSTRRMIENLAGVHVPA